MNDHPSYPWSEGDALFASELNAAIAGAGVGGSVINVLAYGAKGDGVTNDTAAIQAALNTYAGEGTVFIPDTGHPYLVSPLMLPTGTDLLLHGTLLATPGSTQTPVDVVNVSHVTIRGHGAIDGNRSAITASGVACLYIYQSSYVQVSGITLRNAVNWNLNVVASSHVRVDNVSMIGGENSNEFAQGCDDCWLTGCTVDGPDGDGGFSFYGGVTNSGAIGNTIRNAGIADNIPSIGLYVLSDAGQSAACANIVMSDNIIHGCGGQGIAILRTNAGAPHDGVIVSNNHCYGNGQVVYAPGGSSDLYVSDCHHVTFTGNQSEGFGVAGSPNSRGLHVAANVTGVNVIGNQISNVGEGTLTGVGIYISSPTDLMVSGNNIYDDQATQTTAVSIGGTAGPNNQFIGNSCQLPLTVTLQSDTVCANVTSGQWTVGNGTGRGAAVILNGAAGQSSVTGYSVANKARWYVGNQGTGESTGNAGSDFQIIAVNDAGNAFLGTPITIRRASRQVIFEVAPAIATLPVNAANDAAAASAGVLIGGEYRNGSIKMVRVA